MPAAARVTDMHTCPQVEAGPKPHVGGPIQPAGEPTVLIGHQPAAREGDKAMCVGPPDTITQGASTVLIGHKPAARLGDPTEHGGKVVVGCPTVRIGNSPQGAALMGAGAPLGSTSTRGARGQGRSWAQQGPWRSPGVGCGACTNVGGPRHEGAAGSAGGCGQGCR